MPNPQPRPTTSAVTAVRLGPLFPRATRSLLARPFHFLLLQIPAAIGEPIQRLLEAALPDSPLIVALVCLPYFFISFVMCSAATYLSVSSATPLSAGQAFFTALSRWRHLVPAALVVGFVSVLGLAALLLPGFYFTAVYLFVPHGMVDDPTAPLMTHLHRSSRLAHRSLWRTLAVVGAVFVLYAWSYITTQALEASLIAALPSALGRGVWVGGFQALLATVLGAMVDVWICHYYLALRAGEGDVTETKLGQGDSGKIDQGPAGAN